MLIAVTLYVVLGVLFALWAVFDDWRRLDIDPMSQDVPGVLWLIALWPLWLYALIGEVLGSESRPEVQG